jgi:outer membrane protein assembly factor BamB
MKLSVEGSAVRATQVWETKEMICHHGGYIIYQGYLYGNHERGWSCLELATGRKMWFAEGVGKGSLCFADGMLYTYSEGGGRMGLVKAQPEGFEQTGGFRTQGRGPSWAYPVVVGGRLYLRYDDNLYCYDVRTSSSQ